MASFPSQVWGDTSTQCPLSQYALLSRSGRPNSQDVGMMALIFPPISSQPKGCQVFWGSFGHMVFVASTKGHGFQAALASSVWLLLCLALMGWWSGAKASGKRDSSSPLRQVDSYRGRQRCLHFRDDVFFITLQLHEIPNQHSIQ